MIHLRVPSNNFLRYCSTLQKAASPKVAIVGSGPAGFYTAKYLLDKHSSLTVDMMEALPTPFGLVRHGVAPDHPEVKSVVSTFTEVAQHARCRFFGNVSVGMTTKNDNDVSVHVSMDELKKAYDVIVLAYGASSDASLNIPGENLSGVMSARNFVNWYNGHPLHAKDPIDLSTTKRVVIVGQGNVAIDCARILAKSPMELETTDIAPHALHVLRHSAVEEIVITGRRGHIQAAFTIKELRELSKIEGCQVIIHEQELQAGLTEASQHELLENRPKQRIVELITKIVTEATAHTTVSSTTSSSTSSPKPTRKVTVRFLLQPLAIVSDDNGDIPGKAENSAKNGTKDNTKNVQKVHHMVFGKNKLTGDAHHQRAIPITPWKEPVNGIEEGEISKGLGLHEYGYDPKEIEIVPCEMVLKSVGYQSTPIEGVPFDMKTHRVPNKEGRVVVVDYPSIYTCPGLYVSGWLKRGPSGIIGTNITDAKETVACILQDLDAIAKGQSFLKPPPSSIYSQPQQSQPPQPPPQQPQQPSSSSSSSTPSSVISPFKTMDPLDSIPSLRSPHVVTWTDYLRIDKEEVLRGKALTPPKPREKICSLTELVQVAHHEGP